MNKGDFIKCIESSDDGFTVGNEYEVLAIEGDLDISNVSSLFDGVVGKNCICLKADCGEIVYAVYPYCCFGSFELVK